MSLPLRERGLKWQRPRKSRYYAWSLPLRERGLKLIFLLILVCILFVAPLAGAWIEILAGYIDRSGHLVAPLAGAWIEILSYSGSFRFQPVAPLAGAWIEIGAVRGTTPAQRVAPLAGAWIEMLHSFLYLILSALRRSPCGSVD